MANRRKKDIALISKEGAEQLLRSADEVLEEAISKARTMYMENKIYLDSLSKDAINNSSIMELPENVLEAERDAEKLTQKEKNQIDLLKVFILAGKTRADLTKSINQLLKGYVSNEAPEDKELDMSDLEMLSKLTNSRK